MNDPTSLIQWVAEKKNLKPEWISDFKVEASPSRAWSDITMEGFSCNITFTYFYNKEEKHGYWMGEEEVVEFLNSLTLA